MRNSSICERAKEEALKQVHPRKMTIPSPPGKERMRKLNHCLDKQRCLKAAEKTDDVRLCSVSSTILHALDNDFFL